MNNLTNFFFLIKWVYFQVPTSIATMERVFSNLGSDKLEDDILLSSFILCIKSEIIVRFWAESIIDKLNFMLTSHIY